MKGCRKENQREFIPGGAFVVAREIFTNSVWEDVHKLRFWIYLLGNARHNGKPRKIAGVTIKRGQFLRAYSKIGEDCSYIENNSVKRWAKSRVKRMVDSLESEGRITTVETELGTLFTIVNYAKYQELGNYRARRLERSWNDTNNGNNGSSSTDSYEYDKFIEKLSAILMEEDISVRLGSLRCRLAKPFREYGREQMEDAVNRAIPKWKQNGRGGDFLSYSLKILREDYVPRQLERQ